MTIALEGGSALRVGRRRHGVVTSRGAPILSCGTLCYVAHTLRPRSDAHLGNRSARLAWSGWAHCMAYSGSRVTSRILFLQTVRITLRGSLVTASPDDTFKHGCVYEREMGVVGKEFLRSPRGASESMPRLEDIKLPGESNVILLAGSTLSSQCGWTAGS